MRIVLDAGHGKSNRTPGKYDPGMNAIGPGDEHTKAEGMANRVAADLKALGHSVIVIRDIALRDRSAIIKKYKPHLMVSLHFNAGGGHGTEAWVDKGASRRAKRAAAELVYRVTNALDRGSRGVKVSDKLAVLHGTRHDVLLEICFGDNKHDMASFHAHVDNVERAILNGILYALKKPLQTTLPRLR